MQNACRQVWSHPTRSQETGKNRFELVQTMLTTGCPEAAKRLYAKCQKALEEIPQERNGDVKSLKLPSGFTEIAKQNH
jgi:hypothetical protein